MIKLGPFLTLKMERGSWVGEGAGGGLGSESWEGGDRGWGGGSRYVGLPSIHNQLLYSSVNVFSIIGWFRV